MLGRLRMDVDACLDLYQRLGSEIFGRPRRMHVSGNPFRGRWWWPRSKYNTKNLEALLQREIADIITRAPRDNGDGQKGDYFPSDEKQCRT